MLPALMAGAAKLATEAGSAYAASGGGNKTAAMPTNRTDNSQVYFGSYNPPDKVAKNVSQNWIGIAAILAVAMVAIKK